MTNSMSNNTITPSSGNTRRSVADSKVIPMPRTTGDRMAALTDLGATFQEGQHKVSKVATPTDPEMVPSFVDTHQVEALARQNNNDSLQDAAMATKAD
ncbi:hypothetical protein BJV82DRAFT_632566 [Fennellomyces sp. T-0311]|nr:hypothetical protein BJV82DRAFT_632566 [Fennellomyces sp. T-0311]